MPRKGSRLDSFNRVVRSHEALILGLLVGAIVGVLLMIFVTITIKQDNWKVPVAEAHCGKVENVESATYTYTGKIIKVVCKDKRVFDDF